MEICDAKVGDSIFLACGKKRNRKILSISRNKIAEDLKIIDEKGAFAGWLITLCLKKM